MARQSTLARFEISGEILSEETVAALTAADCRLPGGEIDALEFAAAWDLLSEQWQQIRLEIGGYDTERLRRRWLMPLLELMGHEPQFQKSHTVYAEGRTIPLTHRAGDVPIWMLEPDQKADEKLQSGRRRSSPHELLQEYLDLTEDNWGIICTARTIRILHDYHKTLTRNYVEADIESIFEARDVDAFRAVWRIFRAASFVPDPKGVRPIERLSEQSRQEGSEIGNELRKQVLEAIRTLANGFLTADRSGHLRETLLSDPDAPIAFYQALLRIVYRLLFLFYVESRPGWMPHEGATGRIWASSYSITRLREHAEESHQACADGEDLWEGLKVVFGIVRDGNDFFGIHPYGGELFDDGLLWHLDTAALRNSDLLRAIQLLTVFVRDGQVHRVNFRVLRIDALGSVYEALLDVAPVVTPDGVFSFAEGTERKLTGSYYTPPELVAELINSALVPVIEDRLQGLASYEEQREAILGISVVDPACGSGAFLVQALDKLTEYLVRARYPDEEPRDDDVREARRDVVTHCIHGVDLNPMAVELCKFTLWLHVAHPKLPLSYLEPRIRCGNSLIGVPLPSQVEDARRRAREEEERIVAEQRAGRLTQKQAQTRLKASRYVGWPDCVPDEAFEAVAGDAKVVSARLRKWNRQDREQGDQRLFDDDWLLIGRLADRYGQIEAMPEATIEDLRRKAEEYTTYVRSRLYEPARLTRDAWCAAFFWPLDEEHELAPRTQRYRQIEKNPHGEDPWLREQIGRIARTARFFHWDIEFPDVFRRGGFDCVLGNPPWERVKLQEKEWFASRAPEIARAPNKAARQRLITDLRHANPNLYAEFVEANHAAEAESKFLRQSGRFPLCGRGDVNTYAVFAELKRALLAPGGRAGMIVPTGIATDDTTKEFFADLMDSGALVSLYDFENGMRASDADGDDDPDAASASAQPRKRTAPRTASATERRWFPDVHASYKFSLLTVTTRQRPDAPRRSPRFAFFCHRVSDLQMPGKVFTLTAEDIALLNPNTRTCPVFRSRRDAEITRAIYRRVPVLIREGDPNGNPWGITFQRMFDMSNDSGLFRTREELEAAGGTLQGNRWIVPHAVEVGGRMVEKGLWLPLYEAKMIHHFDHRWATYETVRVAKGKKKVGDPDTRDVTLAEKQDPDFVVMPRYWVHEAKVEDAAKTDAAWFIGFRDITNTTNERTAIFGVLPRAAVGNNLPLLNPASRNMVARAMLQACTASFAMDFATRQSAGGTHLNFFIVQQLPVLAPDAYARPCPWQGDVPAALWLGPRVLELTYTAHDLAAFARDLGYDGQPFRWDEERRFLLRCELDAAFFHLYGIERDDVDYIMETFPIVKRKDIAAHGGYRTKETILAIYDAMQRAMDTGERYQTLLDPPPANGWMPDDGAWLRVNEESSEGAREPGKRGARARLEAELRPAEVRNDREGLAEVPDEREVLWVRDAAEAQTNRSAPLDREPSEPRYPPQQPPPPEPLVLSAPSGVPAEPVRRPEPKRLTVNGVQCLLVRRRDTREGEEITVMYESDRSVHRFLTRLAKVEWE